MPVSVSLSVCVVCVCGACIACVKYGGVIPMGLERERERERERESAKTNC